MLTRHNNTYFRRATAFAAFAAAAGLALTGCIGSSGGSSDTASSASGSDTPDQLADGTLTVGLSPDFPPLEYREDGSDEILGSDVDILNELTARLGVSLEISENKFDQLIPSLQTGRVEIVMSGISDTKDRQETADFVDYMSTAGVIYTLSDRADEFTEPDSICGKTLAVSGKTDYYNQVQDLSKETCEDAGKDPVDFLIADSGSAARLQLSQGRADLAVQGRENLTYINEQENNAFAVVLDPLPSNNFGIMVSKDNTALRDVIASTLEEMQEDGTYDKILEKWGLTDSAHDITINQVTN